MEMNVPSPLRVGIELARHIRQNSESKKYSVSVLQGLIADLTVDDDELCMLLKEFVARRSFDAILPLAAAGTRGQLQKDVLMQDVSRIYLPAISAQISDFLDGYLGLERAIDSAEQSPSAVAYSAENEIKLIPNPDTLLVATDEFGEIQVFDYVVYMHYLGSACTESELFSSLEKGVSELDSDNIVKLLKSSPRQPETPMDFQSLHREFLYRIHRLGGAKGIGIKGFRKTLFLEWFKTWDDLEKELVEKGMTMMPSQYWKFFKRLEALTDEKVQSKYFIFNDPDLEESGALSYKAEFWRRFLEQLPGDLTRFLLDSRFRREFLSAFLIEGSIVLVFCLFAYFFTGDSRVWFWLILVPFLFWFKLMGVFDFSE